MKAGTTLGEIGTLGRETRRLDNSNYDEISNSNYNGEGTASHAISVLGGGQG